MIKHYATRAFNNQELMLLELDKKIELVLDNGCELVSINLNTNGTRWIGTIFYRVPKSSKFSLR